MFDEVSVSVCETGHLSAACLSHASGGCVTEAAHGDVDSVCHTCEVA